MEFCDLCNGNGHIFVRSNRDKFVLEETKCPKCGGSGLKDVGPLMDKYYYTQPFKCPVCNGTGMVENPFAWSGNTFEFTGQRVNLVPCHSCGGTGIIWGYYDPDNHETT